MIRSVPGPVQERRQEHVASRVGRKGAHICLHWQQQPDRSAPSLLELQPCAPRAWPPAASWPERSPQSYAQVTLRTDGTVPTSPAEPTSWRATTPKEQRIRVVYLLNVLGFVWSLVIVLHFSEPLEVMGRNLLFADPERVSTWAVQLCHDWSNSGLARRQTCWWWVSFNAENYGTGNFGCYKSQLEVWQEASGSNLWY